MTWRVEWLPKAIEGLAGIYLVHPNKQLISQAANEIDRALEWHPESEGESRPIGRILFRFPLGALFYVDHPAHAVYVVHVWRFRKKNK